MAWPLAALLWHGAMKMTMAAKTTSKMMVPMRDGPGPCNTPSDPSSKVPHWQSVLPAPQELLVYTGPLYQGLATAGAVVVPLVGACLSGWLSHKWGRRVSIFAGVLRWAAEARR